MAQFINLLSKEVFFNVSLFSLHFIQTISHLLKKCIVDLLCDQQLNELSHGLYEMCDQHSQ